MLQTEIKFEHKNILEILLPILCIWNNTNFLYATYQFSLFKADLHDDYLTLSFAPKVTTVIWPNLAYFVHNSPKVLGIGYDNW